MNFDKLNKFHSNVVKLLTNSNKKGRLSHTYLFYGAKGTLKMEGALFLSSLILCENKNACGQCQECKKILEGKNQNIYKVTPETTSIKKEQITDLISDFSRVSDKPRVFIIDGIDKANQTSANTLLKFLEEANDNCYGIMLAENINLVLPTIISRSQLVNFYPISRENISNCLKEQGINEHIAIALGVVSSSLDEAIQLSKDQTIEKILNLVIKISESISIDEYDPILDYIIEGNFLNTADQRVLNNYLIDLLITLENDKINYKINNIDRIVFFDIVSKNKPIDDMNRQLEIIKILMELKEELKYNINVVTGIVSALIKVKRC